MMGDGRVAEWLKAVDCKSTDLDIFIGSNPISSKAPFV